MRKKLEIQKNLIIHAKPELIFKVLTDVENWNLWTGSVRKSYLVKGARFAIGTKVKIVQPKLPPVVWEITEIEDNRAFTWVSNSIGLKVIAKHIIVQIGDHSIVWLVTIYQGLLSNIIYNLTSVLTDKYMTMEAHGLKRVSENRANKPGHAFEIPGSLENRSAAY